MKYRKNYKLCRECRIKLNDDNRNECSYFEGHYSCDNCISIHEDQCRISYYNEIDI